MGHNAIRLSKLSQGAHSFPFAGGLTLQVDVREDGDTRSYRVTSNWEEVEGILMRNGRFHIYDIADKNNRIESEIQRVIGWKSILDFLKSNGIEWVEVPYIYPDGVEVYRRFLSPDACEKVRSMVSLPPIVLHMQQ